MENTPKSSTPQSDKEAIYLDACKKNGYYPTSNEKHTAFEAMESYSSSLIKERDELKDALSVCHDLLRDVDIYYDTHMENSKIKECVNIATKGLNELYKKYPKLFKITDDELNTNNS